MGRGGKYDPVDGCPLIPFGGGGHWSTMPLSYHRGTMIVAMSSCCTRCLANEHACSTTTASR